VRARPLKRFAIAVANEEQTAMVDQIAQSIERLEGELEAL
jgi:hypothetical protein